MKRVHLKLIILMLVTLLRIDIVYAETDEPSTYLYYDTLDFEKVKQNSIVYSLVDEEDQDNIDALIQGIIAGQTEIYLPNPLSAAKFNEFSNIFKGEYGEFITVKHMQAGKLADSRISSVKITYFENISKEEINTLIQFILETRSEMYDANNILLDQIYRVKHITDRVYGRSVYNAANPYMLDWLRSGEMNCIGYSHLLGLLLRDNGIKCSFIGGIPDRSNITIGHLWNIVDLGNGDYRHIDVLFGYLLQDNVKFSSERYIQRYNYYNLEYFLPDPEYDRFILSIYN